MNFSQMHNDHLDPDQFANQPTGPQQPEPAPAARAWTLTAMPAFRKYFVQDQENRIVAEAYGLDNAKLLAAAPRLLKALDQLLTSLHHDHQDGCGNHNETCPYCYAAVLVDELTTTDDDDV